MFSKLQLAVTGLALAYAVIATPMKRADAAPGSMDGPPSSVYGNCLEAQKLGVPCTSDPAECPALEDTMTPCPDSESDDDSAADSDDATSATKRSTQVRWDTLQNNPDDKACDGGANGGYMTYDLIYASSKLRALDTAEKICEKMEGCQAVDVYLDNNANAKDTYSRATKFTGAYFKNPITTSQITNAGGQIQPNGGVNTISSHVSANMRR